MSRFHNQPRLTSDDQLGGGCDVVNGRLRRAGVASGVLQLGVLDEQRAVGAPVLHKAPTAISKPSTPSCLSGLTEI